MPRSLIFYEIVELPNHTTHKNDTNLKKYKEKYFFFYFFLEWVWSEHSVLTAQQLALHVFCFQYFSHRESSTKDNYQTFWIDKAGREKPIYIFYFIVCFWAIIGYYLAYYECSKNFFQVGKN